MQIASPTPDASRAYAHGLASADRSHPGHRDRTEGSDDALPRRPHHAGGAERLAQAVDKVLSGFRITELPPADPVDGSPQTTDEPQLPAADEGAKPSLQDRLSDFVDALYGALREMGGGRGPGRSHEHDDQGHHRGHAWGHHDDHGWRGRGHGSLSNRLEALAAALATPPASTGTGAPTPEVLPPAADVGAGTGTPSPTLPMPSPVDAEPSANDVEVPTVAQPLALADATTPAPAPTDDPLQPLREAFAAMVGTSADGDGSADPLQRFVETLAAALRPGGHSDGDAPNTGLLIDLTA